MGAFDAGRVAGRSGWMWWDLAWIGLLDQLPVTDRIVIDGQLEHAGEDQTAAAGSASVEPEYELIQVVVQVRGVHRVLVRG